MSRRSKKSDDGYTLLVGAGGKFRHFPGDPVSTVPVCGLRVGTPRPYDATLDKDKPRCSRCERDVKRLIEDGLIPDHRA